MSRRAFQIGREMMCSRSDGRPTVASFNLFPTFADETFGGYGYFQTFADQIQTFADKTFADCFYWIYFIRPMNVFSSAKYDFF